MLFLNNFETVNSVAENDLSKEYLSEDTRSRTARLHDEYQNLNLVDDFLFSKVMEDSDILKQLLEKILGIPIQKIENVTPQRVIEMEPSAHGIRLDVYANDENQTHYAVEMQKINQYNIPKRGRYYLSIMDLDQLEKGTDYSNLTQSICIFLCMFDPFKENMQKYTFVRRCSENPKLELHDGTLILILTNAVPEDADPDLTSFFRYSINSTEETAAAADSDLVQRIHDRVHRLKNNSTIEVEYMKLKEHYEEYFGYGFNDGFNDGRELGLREGKELGLLEGAEKGDARRQADTIRRMLKHHLDDASICEFAACSMDLVNEIRTQMGDA